MNKMTPQEMIKEMENSEISVYVTHYRKIKGSGKDYIEKEFYIPKNRRFPNEEERNTVLDEKGGFTEVLLVRQDDRKVFEAFQAYCSTNDRFQYKVGFRLAVERAYAYFLEHLAKIKQAVVSPQVTLDSALKNLVKAMNDPFCVIAGYYLTEEDGYFTGSNGKFLGFLNADGGYNNQEEKNTLAFLTYGEARVYHLKNLRKMSDRIFHDIIPILPETTARIITYNEMEEIGSIQENKTI